MEELKSMVLPVQDAWRQFKPPPTVRQCLQRWLWKVPQPGSISTSHPRGKTLCSFQCPKMAYAQMPEPGRTGRIRNHHYLFFLEVIPLSRVTKTLVTLSPTRPAVLTPLRSPLPTSDASGFCAPGSVVPPLLCQLSWNMSLQFSWLDPDGLYNQICAEVQATHPLRRLAGSYGTQKCALLNKCTFKNRPWCSGGKHLLCWASYRVLESNMVNGCLRILWAPPIAQW